MSNKASDSVPQREAEPKLLNLFSVELGCEPPLCKEELSVGENVVVEIDGFSAKHHILCEVFSHVGKLKPGQQKKIACDILKLIFVSEQLRSKKWRKYLLFQDEDARKKLIGMSWLAEVCRKYKIEPRVVKDIVLRKRVSIAQRQQKMKNV